MRKIRILYAIPNFDTAGSGVALMKLVTGLDRSRFTPMIVCLHDRGRYFETVRASGIPVHVYPYLSPLKPRPRLLSNVLKTSRFFRSLSPDIIFSYHYSSDFSEALAARLAGCRFMYVKKNMGWHGPSKNQWRLKTLLSHAITVQNEDMMKGFFPANPKAHLISIGVDLTEFHPRPQDHDLRNELGLTVTQKIVLCVANLVPKKGIPDLIRAFARSRHRSSCMLLVVGRYETPMWEETKNLIHGLGLDDRVIFTGLRMDVPRFYTIADLFVLPSTGNEGAPIAIQEAMASGVPVLTTDTPGNRDQVRDMPGQMVPPADPEALGDAMDRLLDADEPFRNEIVGRQLRTVEDRYSLKKEIADHERLYLKTMNGRLR
jgi:glycosyltransferase involved in cell wall biosynthesis